MGAMLFGGVTKERIQFNEQTLVPGTSATKGVDFYQAFRRRPYRLSPALPPPPPPTTTASSTSIPPPPASAIQPTAVTYTRELVASLPSNLIAFRLSASRPGTPSPSPPA